MGSTSFCSDGSTPYPLELCPCSNYEDANCPGYSACMTYKHEGVDLSNDVIISDDNSSDTKYRKTFDNYKPEKGLIEVSAVQPALEKYIPTVNATALSNNADSNKDGKINYNEFVGLMKAYESTKRALGPFYCCPNPSVEYEGSDKYCTLERTQTKDELEFNIASAVTSDPLALTDCNDENAYLFPMPFEKGKLMCGQVKGDTNTVDNVVKGVAGLFSKLGSLLTP